MICAFRLFSMLVMFSWLFTLSVYTADATGDSGQLFLTLRIPSATEIAQIVDPLDASHALALYGELSHSGCGKDPNFPGNNCPAYIMVNIVHWTPTAAPGSGDAHAPDSAWYLIHPQSDRTTHLSGLSLAQIQMDGALRIFGNKNVGLLVVHIGVSPLAHFEVRYTIEAKAKKSVQETDALALINLVLGGSKVRAAGSNDYLVGAREISNVAKLPSDITVSGGAYPGAPSPSKDQKPAATFTQTYDDEGFAFWDVSIGIPVKGVNEVQYSSDGTVAAKTVTKVNAYGLAHWYPYPADLKSNYPWQPSVVGGLPLSGKPLNKPFVGLAIGTRKPLPFRVNVFAGVVFNKVFTPQSLAVGSKASPTQLASNLHAHRVRKLLIGVDIPISQFISAISKGKSQ
jgi:hypothetical protein